MGANPKQASGLLFFLLAFVLIAAGMAMSGNLLLILIGIVLLGLRHDLPESEAAGARRELTTRRLSYRADKKERALCYLPEFS